jgi:hypothetical protein
MSKDKETPGRPSRLTANKVVVVFEENRAFNNVVSLKLFMNLSGLSYDNVHELLKKGKVGQGFMSAKLPDVLNTLFGLGAGATAEVWTTGSLTNKGEAQGE